MGFGGGRLVADDGWFVTRDIYRLPGRSTCIRWCRSFVRFCKGRAEQARGSDELPGAQRRTETGETGAEASGERTAQASGRRGSRESADGHDRERNESLEDGGGGTAGATGSGGRTDPGISFRPAHVVEALGEDRDPRNPKTIRHKSTVLLLYGILLFVFQMASRREANRQMTLPQFQENLRRLFPELESVAHQDTLNRLLAVIEVNEIEEALVELIQRFIRKRSEEHTSEL